MYPILRNKHVMPEMYNNYKSARKENLLRFIHMYGLISEAPRISNKLEGYPNKFGYPPINRLI